MNLLIDIGNSCLKWAQCVAGRLQERGRTRYRKDQPEADFNAAWQSLPAPDVIYLSNVSGPRIETRLRVWSRRQWGSQLHCVSAARSLAGVVNGYHQPAQLGSDRWLALIAAWKKYARTLCVIDCGTTMTLDLLDTVGRHQGGMIFPGSGLMRQSLARGTATLPETVPAPAPATLLGRSTAEAITIGQRHALVGMLEHALNEIQRHHGPELLCLFCGGEASSLLSQWPAHYRHEPDLVLEGLAHCSQEQI